MSDPTKMFSVCCSFSNTTHGFCFPCSITEGSADRKQAAILFSGSHLLLCYILFRHTLQVKTIIKVFQPISKVLQGRMSLSYRGINSQSAKLFTNECGKICWLSPQYKILVMFGFTTIIFLKRFSCKDL